MRSVRMWISNLKSVMLRAYEACQACDACEAMA